VEDYTAPMMENEMDGANRDIQRLLGGTATTFANPCGQKSTLPRFIHGQRAAKQTGYFAAGNAA
jgi:hypothetical protein